jgi:hypothetical protein
MHHGGIVNDAVAAAVVASTTDQCEGEDISLHGAIIATDTRQVRVLGLVVVLVACGAPKRPAPIDDVDVPPQRSLPIEPQAVAVDAQEQVVETTVDANIDAAVAALPPAAAGDPGCTDDPVSRQACESMGANFEPRIVTPCHRGAATEGPMAPKPRCMCVDVTKPRDCTPKK